MLVSHKPFGAALTLLVSEVEDVYVTPRGLKIASFVEVLDGISRRELRAAVHGDELPSPRLMEECARFLRVRPEYFREYRVLLRNAA